MLPEKSLVILFFTFAGFLAVSSEISDVLEFQHRSYAVAVKEYHKLATKILRVKATGCSDDISYAIVETDVPFKIHPTKGKISITKDLDFDKKSVYTFSVRAESTKRNCVAYTQVEVDVLKVNEHRPKLSSDIYLCQVIENSRSVKIYPEIKAKDSDSGKAGEIAAINIVSENVPFMIKQDDDGKWQLTVTQELDAEKVTGYEFNIEAVDKGEIPKRSNTSKVVCKVVDVNEFSPKFKQDSYITTISTGRTYNPVLKIEATDEDVDAHFGRVCDYTILDNVPFTINHTGHIKLSQPLNMDSPDNYVFAVEAKDCGGMVSKENTMVTIIVNKDCSPSFNKEIQQEVNLAKCLSNVKVTPNIELSECVKKGFKTADFTAVVKMTSLSDARECDRDGYDATSLFKLCGTDGIIDLLPPRGPGHEWVESVKDGEGLEGNLTFKFDGKSAVELPENLLPGTLGKNFTLATWIRTQVGKEDQIIVASSDRRRLDRLHFALYTTPAKHLVFVHRLENELKRVTYCKSEFHWKPDIFDDKWHYIAINLDVCEVKMYTDGVYQEAVEFKSNWPLHNSHVPVRVVVGARWLGREMSYQNYFEGYLSGLVVRPNHMTNIEVFGCLMGCREMLGINTVIPDSFDVTTENHATIKITGHGTPAEFEELLQNVAYANSRSLPSPGKRDISVVAMINKRPIPLASSVVFIDEIERPVIKISGCQADSATTEDLKNYGKPICSKMEVNIDMCSHHLDMAHIAIHPPLTSGESIVFPGTILDDYGLRSHVTPDGLWVRGVASYKAYERVLQEMVYINTMAHMQTQKKFKIDVSDLNGRLKSNEIVVELNILHSKADGGFQKANFYDQTAEENILPGAVAVENSGAMATTSSSAGMVAIIIIASTCIFVFLVVIGVYRLRKTAEKNVLRVPADESEIEWDYAGEGMNITVNPMQKFEELDLGSHSDEDDGGEDTETEAEPREEGEPTRMEWDNSIGI